MFASLAALALLTASCGSAPKFVAKHEPWREEEEQACLRAGIVRHSPSLVTRAALGGPEACGAIRPFEMSGTSDGRIAFKPAAMLRCPMIPAVERWIGQVVEPAARRYLGAPVVEITVAASYSCRPINHVWGAKLSEHGHANALDVSAFTLADGRRIAVKSGWHGDPRESAFLRAVHAGGCAEFTTVLGPNADANHHDHFHFDLARRGRDGLGHICK